MDKPVRVQLRRTKGWKMPPNTLSVARPTVFGNPFPVGKPSGYLFKDDGDPTPMIASLTREQAVAFYRELANGHITPEMHPWGHDWHTLLVRKIGGSPFEWIRSELRGKNLACWCHLPKEGEPDICHARVLLELANK